MKTIKVIRECDFCGTKGADELQANGKFIKHLDETPIKVIGRNNKGMTFKACPTCAPKVIAKRGTQS